MCDLFVTIPSDYTIPIVKISVSFECLIYSDVSHHLTTDTTKGAWHVPNEPYGQKAHGHILRLIYAAEGEKKRQADPVAWKVDLGKSTKSNVEKVPSWERSHIPFKVCWEFENFLFHRWDIQFRSQEWFFAK